MRSHWGGKDPCPSCGDEDDADLPVPCPAEGCLFTSCQAVVPSSFKKPAAGRRGERGADHGPPLPPEPAGRGAGGKRAGRRGARRGPRLATLGPGDARWEARPGGYGPTGRGASSCPPRCRGLRGGAASRGRGGRRGRRQHTLRWGPRAPRRAPHRGSRRCSCGCDVSGWPRVPCRLPRSDAMGAEESW